MLLLVLALFALGCGKGDSDSTVSTVEKLRAALADTTNVSTYRLSHWTAQTLQLDFAGIDESGEIDQQEPTTLAEISPGRQHYVVDMGALLAPVTGEKLDIKFEIWNDDERLVIDTRSFESILDRNPGAQLGPFAPGLAYVDLGGSEFAGPELLAAIAGSAPPDLKVLATKLSESLIDVEQTASDPQTFAGTITLADLTEAQGQDVEVVARSGAAGLALNASVDIDTLTELYIDVYESTEAEVVIELDESGLMRSLSSRVDLSGVYSALFEVEGLIPDLSASERQEALDDVRDAVHILHTRTVFEPDSNLEVPLLPATADDRTELWLEHLVNSGFG